MSDSLYSKDTNTRLLSDEIDNASISIIKHKIVFGPDGSYEDVTDTTPFPVTSVTTPMSPTNVYEGAFNLPNTTDSMFASYPLSTQEVYQFYNGGSGGTLLATLTVNYTDSTKFQIQSVVRT